jgi:hypothetical protein
VTTTSTTTSTTTTTTTTTSTTTFQMQHDIPFVEGWSSTSTTTTSTTTAPSYPYEWGVGRKAGLSHPSAELVSVVIPTPTAGMGPYSLKTYVQVDDKLGIFDGDNENKIEDGTNLNDWNVLAPENAASYSTTTTSTTTTSTTTTTL